MVVRLAGRVWPLYKRIMELSQSYRYSEEAERCQLQVSHGPVHQLSPGDFAGASRHSDGSTLLTGDRHRLASRDHLLETRRQAVPQWTPVKIPTTGRTTYSICFMIFLHITKTILVYYPNCSILPQKYADPLSQGFAKNCKTELTRSLCSTKPYYA